MAKQTAKRSPQLTADSRVYNLGYSRGYEDGHEDGLEEGKEALKGWLLAEIRDVEADMRLDFRSDISTALDAIAAIIEMIKEGQPISVHDDAAQRQPDVDGLKEGT